MKKIFTPIAVVSFLSLLLTSSVLFAETTSDRIESCKHELTNSLKASFKNVLVCKNDDPSSYYPYLCYGDYTEVTYSGKVSQNYRTLQISKDERGAWSTIADLDTVILGDGSVQFTADQRVLMGNSTLTDVDVDVDSMKISLNVYKKSFFSKQSLGIETYSCGRK